MDMSIDDAVLMLDKMEESIEYALLLDVFPVAREAIAREVYDTVYDYEAAPVFMASRRFPNGGISGEKSIDGDAVGRQLTITDRAGLQNLWSNTWSADVTTIVQEGSKQFNQPYPRPFLNEAIQRAIQYGEIDNALKLGLKKQGINVD